MGTLADEVRDLEQRIEELEELVKIKEEDITTLVGKCDDLDADWYQTNDDYQKLMSLVDTLLVLVQRSSLEELIEELRRQ